MKSTKSRSLILVAAFLAVALTGCFHKTVVWHPGGTGALFDEGLYVMAVDGQVSDILIPNAYTGEWMSEPESGGRGASGNLRLVVAVMESADTWEALSAGLHPVHRQRVETIGLRGLRSIQSEAPWSATIAAMKTESNTAESDQEIAAAYLWLRDVQPEMLEEAKDVNREELSNATVEYSRLLIATIRGLEVVEAKDATPFFLGPVADIRVSPNNQAVAFSLWWERTELWVANLSNLEQCLLVDEHPVSMHPDWHPDGVSLVYARQIRADAMDELSLGVIRKSRLINDAGEIQVDGKSWEDLAGVMFDPRIKIRCLYTRIIFSSLPVTLPARVLEYPDRQRLFVIDSRSAATSLLLPSGATTLLPDSLATFEVNNDGTWVSVADEHAKVWAIKVATGAVHGLVETTASELAVFPTWRGSELVFAHPEDRAQKVEASLKAWSPLTQSTKTLSSRMPDALKKSLLD
jgi:hypothetical protein